MTTILLNLQMTILTYIALGFILYKIKLIEEISQNFLSRLVLEFLLPVSVFVSFVESMSFDLIGSLMTILILAIAIEIVLFLVTKIPNKFLSPEQKSVADYGFLVSNGGLIGTPVIQGLFGSVGVIYCNVFMIPTRIMAYSAGESVFNPSNKRSAKEIGMAIITNKVILSMLIAIPFFALSIPIPTSILISLENVAACLSPMSLILVGSMLAEKMDFDFSMFTRIGYITMVRLVIIPLSVMTVCLFLNVGFQNTAIITLLLGMPVGSTCAMFAKKYNGHTSLASMTVFVTTLLSSVTLVLLMKLIEHLFT